MGHLANIRAQNKKTLRSPTSPVLFKSLNKATPRQVTQPVRQTSSPVALGIVSIKTGCVTTTVTAVTILMKWDVVCQTNPVFLDFVNLSNCLDYKLIVDYSCLECK